MTDEQREKIKQLAAVALDKKLIVEGLGMVNMPTDYTERRQSAIAYALARAEWFEADAALEAAIRPNEPKAEKV